MNNKKDEKGKVEKEKVEKTEHTLLKEHTQRGVVHPEKSKIWLRKDQVVRLKKSGTIK